MTNINEFIERHVEPVLGEHAGDYDLRGIAVEVSDWDERDGYVMREGITEEDFWNVVRQYDVSAKERR